MRIRIAISACAAALLGLGGCTQETAAPENSPFRLTATIQDLMDNEVDPSADFIWEAVSLVSTPTGTVDKQPRTDEEWAEVRRHAITLVEATNLLVMEGRTVAVPGKKLEDAEIPGNLPAEEIQKAIDGNRAAFVMLAHGLHDTASEALAAVDAKDTNGLELVGEKIDAACEACHETFWYPNSEQPIQ